MQLLVILCHRILIATWQCLCIIHNYIIHNYSVCCNWCIFSLVSFAKLNRLNAIFSLFIYLCPHTVFDVGLSSILSSFSRRVWSRWPPDLLGAYGRNTSTKGHIAAHLWHRIIQYLSSIIAVFSQVVMSTHCCLALWSMNSPASQLIRVIYLLFFLLDYDSNFDLSVLFSELNQ